MMTITDDIIDSWIKLPKLEQVAEKVFEHFTEDLYIKHTVAFEQWAGLLIPRIFCIDEDGRALISYSELSVAAKSLMHIGEVSKYQSRVFLEEIDYFPRSATELFKAKQAQENKDVRALLLKHADVTYLIHEIGAGVDGALAQVCPYEEMLGQVPRLVDRLHTNNKYIGVDYINSMFSSIFEYFNTNRQNIELIEQLSFLLTLKDIKFGSGISHSKQANKPVFEYEYVRMYNFYAEVLGPEHLDLQIKTAELLGTLPSYDCWRNAICKNTPIESVELPCSL